MKLPSKNIRRRQGFTIIELILVMVIIATLAAIVIPKFAGRSEQAKLTAAKADIASISLGLDAFEVDTGSYPRSGNLDLLVTPPNDATGWKGPYLSKGIPLDPWGSAYSYEYPGKHNVNGYDLVSAGPDGRMGTDDDITNWDANKK